jgi:lipid-binding SYLF domain-containing protein
MMRTLSILAAAIVATSALAGSDASSQSKRFTEATQVLQASVTAPDKGIPKEYLERAECVGVFPGVTKAAFLVGGEYGKGVFTCRQPDGTMGAPAFFSMGGGSLGWQFGGERTDIVVLIMNENGVKHLLEDRFTIGGAASAAAGPVGRTAKAATDAQLHAQILSWSRSRGAFIGASLEGNVLSPDKKQIEATYGDGMTAREILVDHKASIPKTAQSFVKLTTEYSKRES